MLTRLRPALVLTVGILLSTVGFYTYAGVRWNSWEPGRHIWSSKAQLHVVFFVPLPPEEAYTVSIISQFLEALQSCGLYAAASSTHVILSGNFERFQELTHFVRLTLPGVQLLLVDASQSDAGIRHAHTLRFGHAYILYFRAEGIEQGRHPVPIWTNFDIVVGNWRSIVEMFDQNPKAQIIGSQCSENRPVWEDFWWARASYLSQKTDMETECSHFRSLCPAKSMFEDTMASEECAATLGVERWGRKITQGRVERPLMHVPDAVAFRIDRIRESSGNKLAIYSSSFGKHGNNPFVPPRVHAVAKYLGADMFFFSDFERAEGGHFFKVQVDDVLEWVPGYREIKDPYLWNKKPYIANRVLKIFGPHIFSRYERSMYMDDNVYLGAPPPPAITESIWVNDFVHFQHPDRDCPYHEVDVVLSTLVGSKVLAKGGNISDWKMNLFGRLENRGVEEHSGLAWCYWLVRSNSTGVRRVMEAWFGHYLHFFRDQPALSAALHELGGTISVESWNMKEELPTPFYMMPFDWGYNHFEIPLGEQFLARARHAPVKPPRHLLQFLDNTELYRSIPALMMPRSEPCGNRTTLGGCECYGLFQQCRADPSDGVVCIAELADGQVTCPQTPDEETTCFCAPATFCANEPEPCTCNGAVALGVGQQWSVRWIADSRWHHTPTKTCHPRRLNMVDPAPEVPKSCYCISAAETQSNVPAQHVMPMLPNGKTFVNFTDLVAQDTEAEQLPNAITMVVPVYNNVRELERNLEMWASYRSGTWQAVVIDDGSTEEQNVAQFVRNWEEVHGHHFGQELEIVEILEDKPYNMPQAYNLGALLSRTRYILVKDVDHYFDAENWERVVGMGSMLFSELTEGPEYLLFARKAVGDGPLLKENPNVYLIDRHLFVRTGGYDEDFAGYYGCDVEFRHRLHRYGVQPHRQLPDVFVWVDVHGGSPGLKRKKTPTVSRMIQTKSSLESHPINSIRVPWRIVRDEETQGITTVHTGPPVYGIVSINTDEQLIGPWLALHAHRFQFISVMDRSAASTPNFAEHECRKYANVNYTSMKTAEEIDLKITALNRIRARFGRRLWIAVLRANEFFWDDFNPAVSTAVIDQADHVFCQILHVQPSASERKATSRHPGTFTFQFLHAVWESGFEETSALCFFKDLPGVNFELSAMDMNDVVGLRRPGRELEQPRLARFFGLHESDAHFYQTAKLANLQARLSVPYRPRYVVHDPHQTWVQSSVHLFRSISDFQPPQEDECPNQHRLVATPSLHVDNCTELRRMSPCLPGSSVSLVVLHGEHNNVTDTLWRAANFVQDRPVNSSAYQLISNKSFTVVDVQNCLTVHQVYVTIRRRPPEHVRHNIVSLNPGLKYKLWMESEADPLVRQSDLLWDWFRNSKDKRRAELLRFIILANFGGIYSDVDIEWLVPFSRVLNKGADFYSALGSQGPVKGLSEMSIGFMVSFGPSELLSAWMEKGGAEAPSAPYYFNTRGVCSLLREWVGPDNFGPHKLMSYQGRKYYLFREVGDAKGGTYFIDADGTTLARVNYHNYLQRSPTPDPVFYRNYTEQCGAQGELPTR